MGFVLMGIATVVTLSAIIFMFAGRKYAQLTDNLEAGKFPLKDMCVIGFFWNYSGILRLKGKKMKELRNEAVLLYELRYRDYYATLHWAQALSITHVAAAIFLLFAGITGSIMIFAVGVVVCAILYLFSIGMMKRTLSERSEACLVELPDMISKLALLVSSGMVLREAWFLIADSKTSPLYELMKKICSDMNNGMSDIDAIHRFGILSNVPEIKKFSSALIQSIEKGGSDLVSFLMQQSTEIWSQKKQIMLQRGEKAASKLVLPIGLMFVGVLIIVLSVAVGSLAAF